MIEMTHPPTPEFSVGAEIPIKEHSTRSGPCSSQIGRVTKLDSNDPNRKALTATCKKCNRPAMINWNQIQAGK